MTGELPDPTGPGFTGGPAMSLGDDGPFSRAVDKAVEDANAAYLATDPAEREAIARENADRWLAITAARDAAGRHGVVLPVATADAVVRMLRGGDVEFFTPTLLANMVEQAIPKETP